MSNTLLIRADADSRIGHGHIMRCLALAQAWQDRGGTAIFASARLPVTLEERLLADGFEIVQVTADPGTPDDSLQTIAHACERGATWIGVDGYDFKADYQKRLRDADLRVLFLDDNQHAEHHVANIVLNQNLHAREEHYKCREPGTRLLLGTRFVLLRREFKRWGEWQREIPEVARHILVTFGGSDTGALTTTTLEALQQIVRDETKILVVTTCRDEAVQSLRSMANGSRGAIRLEEDTVRMSEHMAWADLAVTAGGSTCWESAVMGLPACVVVLADNQQENVAILAEVGQVVSLGEASALTVDRIAGNVEALLVDHARRQHMNRHGREIVDGRGARRVVDAMTDALKKQNDSSLASANSDLKLRRANERDSKLLWRWANDSEVRGFAFNSDPIEWEAHCAWLRSKLADSKCTIFIVADREEAPVGQVRFDIEGEDAVVTVSIGVTSRARGYGAESIRLACGEMFEHNSIERIFAYIKPSNAKSQKSFAQARFVPAGPTTVHRQPALLFVLHRNAAFQAPARAEPSSQVREPTGA